MPDFHPYDWIAVVEALSVYDQWRDRDDNRAQRIFELNRRSPPNTDSIAIIAYSLDRTR